MKYSALVWIYPYEPDTSWSPNGNWKLALHCPPTQFKWNHHLSSRSTAPEPAVIGEPAMIGFSLPFRQQFFCYDRVYCETNLWTSIHFVQELSLTSGNAVRIPEAISLQSLLSNDLLRFSSCVESCKYPCYASRYRCFFKWWCFACWYDLDSSFRCRKRILCLILSAWWEGELQGPSWTSFGHLLCF